MNNMLISKKELKKLNYNSILDLYYILLDIEDQLDYKNKKITKTIDFIQKYYNGGKNK